MNVNLSVEDLRFILRAMNEVKHEFENKELAEKLQGLVPSVELSTKEYEFIDDNYGQSGVEAAKLLLRMRNGE